MNGHRELATLAKYEVVKLQIALSQVQKSVMS
jgi:hypothetical protein